MNAHDVEILKQRMEAVRAAIVELLEHRRNRVAIPPGSRNAKRFLGVERQLHQVHSDLTALLNIVDKIGGE